MLQSLAAAARVSPQLSRWDEPGAKRLYWNKQARVAEPRPFPAADAALWETPYRKHRVLRIPRTWRLKTGSSGGKAPPMKCGRDIISNTRSTIFITGPKVVAQNGST